MHLKDVWTAAPLNLTVRFMQEDIILVKGKTGRKNLQKTTQERASLKHYRKRLMENVYINRTIMWLTTRSSIWSSLAGQQQHSACAVLPESKRASSKSWVQKEKSVVTWKKTAFPFMIFLPSTKRLLSSITRQAGMAVVTLASSGHFCVI